MIPTKTIHHKKLFTYDQNMWI